MRSLSRILPILVGLVLGYLLMSPPEWLAPLGPWRWLTVGAIVLLGLLAFTAWQLSANLPADPPLEPAGEGEVTGELKALCTRFEALGFQRIGTPLTVGSQSAGADGGLRPRGRTLLRDGLPHVDGASEDGVRLRLDPRQGTAAASPPGPSPRARRSRQRPGRCGRSSRRRASSRCSSVTVRACSTCAAGALSQGGERLDLPPRFLDVLPPPAGGVHGGAPPRRRDHSSGAPPPAAPPTSGR